MLRAAFIALFAGLASHSHGQIIQIWSTNQSPHGAFGDAAATVPDLSGDGIRDIVIGAPGETIDGYLSAGRVYIYSGANGALLRHISPPNSESDQDFGECVAGVPDMDGDGFGDILIGSPDADPDLSPNDAGRAYLYSGASGARIRTFASPFQEFDGSFGDDVAVIPDINGDGRPDFLISAPREDAGAIDAGRVYVFSGATGALIRTLVSPNPDIGGDFGDSISAVPDVNGDGWPDIVVGAPFENPPGSPADCGRVYIFSGATGVLLRTLQSTGQEAGGNFGESVAGSADLDGDGRGDVIIGAPRENPNNTPRDCGRVHIHSGATGALLQRLIPPVQQVNGNFGFTVASVPDRNGDGRPEILVGASGERIAVAGGSTHSPSVNTSSGPLSALNRRSGTGALQAPSHGRVHLYAGGAWNRLATFNSPAPMAGGSFGRAVAGLSLPGGTLRLVIGAPGESATPTIPHAGRSYLMPY